MSFIEFKLDPNVTSGSAPAASDQRTVDREPSVVFKAYTLPQAMQKNHSLKWNTLQEAQVWMENESRDKIFDFAPNGGRQNPRLDNPKTDWTRKIIYMCSRGAAGGSAKYVRKTSGPRKKPSRFCNCLCRLTLTVHLDGKVTGSYMPEHNHEIGAANARFTRDPSSERQRALELRAIGKCLGQELPKDHQTDLKQQGGWRLISNQRI